MSEFEIEVVGAERRPKPERQPTGLLRKALRLLRALLMRPRALILSGLAAFVLFVGTPHIGWDYQCRYRSGPGEPCESAEYCAYYGIRGRRVVFPASGQSCKLITFLPLDWDRLL
ncbi:MAG: hypothetical protein H6843_08915 [Rhodospirillaceae bacterium]|nr:hypothetical protein [Rhodospirillaceae bacterium]